MAQLRITLFGAFQVQHAGVPVTRFRGDKVRALLAYLAVEPAQPFERSTLAGLLWPDQGEPQALRNLSQALFRLSEALGDLPLHLTRQTVQWREEAAEVDVRAFIRLTRSRETADLAQAAALYRGELLAGFSLPGCEAFDEWLMLTREHLLQVLLAALDTLAEQHLAAGRFSHAADAAHRQIEVSPLGEAAHRQLMRALALSGDRAAALAQYAHCCQVLEAELGVEPDEQTHALYEQIRTGDLQRAPALPTAPAPPALHAHDEAPEPGRVYGRERELALLRRWLLDEQCQVVALLGIGGVGKTTLGAVLARTVAAQFDLLYWRSLLNAPPLDELLRPLLQALTGQALTTLPTSLDDQLALLLDHLRKRRCLIVLDNLDSLIEPDGLGRMRAGYESYAQLLQWLAHSRHQSCLLLTSRERPQGLARWEADLSRVRVLRLEGLDPVASQSILDARGLHGQAQEAQTLVAHYSGHPLALKLVAETVSELFGGSISTFLHEESLFFDDIRAVLDQQWSRLSALEQELLTWLALEREPVDAAELRNHLVRKPAPRQFLEALRALQRRSLLEQGGPTPLPAPAEPPRATFTLQHVIMEYVTERLVDDVCRAIERGDHHCLDQYALRMAQSKDYVRHSQSRTIVQPLAERLVGRLGLAGLEVQLQRLLARLRTRRPQVPGYAAANILTLLLHLGRNLRGYDFSGLTVCQADLRGVSAPEVNFAGSDLAGSVFTDAFNQCHMIAFSPDGQWLVGGTACYAIQVWRVADRQLHSSLRGHTNFVQSATFSPDGLVLASGDADGMVVLWDLALGQPRHARTEHTGWVRSVAFSPDGALLASGGDDGVIRLWDTHTGHVSQTLHGHADVIKVVAFSPDGRLLASGGAASVIHLWDVATGRSYGTLAGHTRNVPSVAFHPSGTLLASSENQTVQLWDVARLRLRTTLHGHTGPVHAVAFSGDGALLASSGDDRSVRIWDFHTGAARHILAGHTGAAHAIAFSPKEALLASAGWDRTIRLWDPYTGRALHTLFGYSNGASAARFSPDGSTLASSHGDRLVRLWEVTGHQAEVRRTLAHPEQAFTLAFNPAGTLLATGCNDHMVRLWDAGTGQLLRTLHGHTWLVWSVAFSPDGSLLASGSIDGMVRLWDAGSGVLRGTLRGHRREIESVAFSPDGTLLASGSEDHTIRVWKLDTGELARTLEGHTNGIWCVAFSPDGTLLASSSEDQTVRLWEVHSGRAISVLRGHTSEVLTVAFSPDGQLLVSSSGDETIKLWDVHTGACVNTLAAEKPYAGMNITGARGLSGAQQAALRTLGAVDGASITSTPPTYRR